MRVNQACGVGVAVSASKDGVDLRENDPTEIGNKVPAGSVNRFAPDSWPSKGVGFGKGVDRSRGKGARGVCVESERGKGGLTIKY